MICCDQAVIVPGDDWVRPYRLTVVEAGERAAYPVAPNATVSARLAATDGTVLIPATLCAADHPDGDWSAGVVVVRWPRDVTAGLSMQAATVLIAVDDGTRTTWRADAVVS